VQTTNKDVIGFWDELAKSMTSHADVKKERQILVENLARQASQLRLQSTIMSASPKAVIDGGLVGEGDVVASFRVLRIEPRRITVEREGIKLAIQTKELSMPECTVDLRIAIRPRSRRRRREETCYAQVDQDCRSSFRGRVGGSPQWGSPGAVEDSRDRGSRGCCSGRRERSVRNGPREPAL
jgi:hypothetical protein